jgi:hypothetical protein
MKDRLFQIFCVYLQKYPDSCDLAFHKALEALKEYESFENELLSEQQRVVDKEQKPKKQNKNNLTNDL